ncbi:GntR family transcriptional regulator [Tumebacillus sp. BK434]|uniref:FadR/GntR family transcriptional regulator n=1 Tax=Tumebacillus sp. BK434 TaxID=2512169 RepID=UPI00104A62C7|nr:FadR/GntR family transcriptional regulator [Tumebacillus sp. BK434]TCP53866.1 GntR family transcriptional regulator [Tumebacillus sp. BK434]
MNTKPAKPTTPKAKSKTKPTKIYEEVARHIKRMIEDGVLAPGDKLPPMTELAKQFGVSRAAVREAFSSLVGMGLIDLRHGEGTFVQRIDVQTMIIEPMNAALLLGRSNLRDLLEMRRLLETGTVQAACERRTEEGLLRIKQALEGQETARHTLEEQVACDLQFHIAIAEASGNNVLLNLMNTLSEALRSTLRATHETAADPEASIREHRLLYEAIAAGDAKRAALLIHAHLEHGERQILVRKT